MVVVGMYVCACMCRHSQNCMNIFFNWIETDQVKKNVFNFSAFIVFIVTNTLFIVTIVIIFDICGVGWILLDFEIKMTYIDIYIYIVSLF